MRWQMSAQLVKYVQQFQMYTLTLSETKIPFSISSDFAFLLAFMLPEIACRTLSNR